MPGNKAIGWKDVLSPTIVSADSALGGIEDQLPEPFVANFIRVPSLGKVLCRAAAEGEAEETGRGNPRHKTVLSDEVEKTYIATLAVFLRPGIVCCKIQRDR